MPITVAIISHMAVDLPRCFSTTVIYCIGPDINIATQVHYTKNSYEPWFSFSEHCRCFFPEGIVSMASLKAVRGNSYYTEEEKSTSSHSNQRGWLILIEEFDCLHEVPNSGEMH